MRLPLRQLTSNVYAGGLIITLVIAVGIGLLANYLKEQYIEDTQRSLAALSTVLSDQADRALQAIELLQQNVIDDVAASGVQDEAGFVAAMSDRSMHDVLRSHISALPQINAITIIADDGKLLNFSRFWPIPNVNISDRDYFQAIRRDHSIQRFVSQPVPNRGDGKWTLYIARRISAPNGQFLGLVLGAVELDYFTRLYHQISSAPDFVFSLFRTDGMLLVRYPPRAEAIGKLYSKAGSQIIASVSAAGGVIRATSPIDHQDRLVSTTALAHFPIRFSISRTTDAALARWREQVLALVCGGLLLEACLFSALWLRTRATRTHQRLRESERARDSAESQARSERAVREHLGRVGTALDNMAQGLCMLDASGKLVIANEQLARLFGLPDLPPVGSGTLAILRYILPDRLLPRQQTRNVLAQLRRAHADRTPMQVTETFGNGRSVLIHVQPIETGGILLTCNDMTEQRQAAAKIAFLAHYDTLTELPNRNSLLATLERVLLHQRSNDVCAVLFINVQRFREVNDTFGHAVGDLLLQEIASRLRAFAGSTDLIARLGGDEFAIAVSTKNAGSIAAVSERLVEHIAVPCELDGRVISVGVRVGIAVAPTDGVTADDLLQKAQLAMHCARIEAAVTPLLFRPEMVGAMQARRQLETELLAALNNDEFELHFQPLVQLSTYAVVGFEALLRWNHPQRGMVPPNEFIPVAEQTGLIVPIGEWVIRTACTQAASWPAQQRIAVNLSPVQVRDRRLVPIIRTVLAESGLEPSRLEMEITETVLLRDTAETLEVLHDIRRLGASVALDDFGTGFSSLSYLRSFPFDKVKIDRAFVRDLATSRDARAIVRAILGLCSELGINTLAEGIELTEQADALIAEGCRDGQGFLFGRAVPVASIGPFLKLSTVAAPALEPLT